MAEIFPMTPSGHAWMKAALKRLKDVERRRNTKAIEIAFPPRRPVGKRRLLRSQGRAGYDRGPHPRVRDQDWPWPR